MMILEALSTQRWFLSNPRVFLVQGKLSEPSSNKWVLMMMTGAEKLQKHWAPFGKTWRFLMMMMMLEALSTQGWKKGCMRVTRISP